MAHRRLAKRLLNRIVSCQPTWYNIDSDDGMGPLQSRREKIMLHIIKDAEGYRFERIDEDGDSWELGTATECVQDEGTPDEYRWFKGTFDTRLIEFDSDEQLETIIGRRKPGDEITWN